MEGIHKKQVKKPGFRRQEKILSAEKAGENPQKPEIEGVEKHLAHDFSQNKSAGHKRISLHFFAKRVRAGSCKNIDNNTPRRIQVRARFSFSCKACAAML
ncbi:MAG: hypothetical protein IJL39_03115 [Clostridia bacterium]|nr:hypothetical protein [Clostridia bacterium]